MRPGDWCFGSEYRFTVAYDGVEAMVSNHNVKPRKKAQNDPWETLRARDSHSFEAPPFSTENNIQFQTRFKHDSNANLMSVATGNSILFGRAGDSWNGTRIRKNLD
jgi:hypothetical protein